MALSQLELTQKPFIELQIEALVQENRIKSKRAKKFVELLQARVASIKDLNYTKLLSRTFRLPLVGRPNNPTDDDYPKAFKFVPPESIQAIGGYTTRTSLKRTNYIDLVVQVPAKCFEKKDVKNQRYHHKRALYLAQLARLLHGPTGFGLVDKVEYCFHHGDFLKPVIILTPRSPKLKELNILFQIFAVPEPDFDIKTSLLTPDHGNVAPKWFFAHSLHEYEATEEISKFMESDSTVSSTPYYNSSILADIEMTANSDIIKEHIRPKTSIAEALLLTKIWLYQRELHQHFSFILSMLLTYLITKQKVHRNMSSYQIFKVIVKTISEQDWTDPGLSFFDDSADKLQSFRTAFPIVFLSPSGNLNLCYNVTKDMYARLKHEAKIAMDIFMSGSPQTFDKLFLRKIDFISKFDVIVHIPKLSKKLPNQIIYFKRLIDFGVISPRLYSDTILDLADRSLTDRVLLVQQNPNDLLVDRWSTKSIPLDPANDNHKLSLGLLLDAEKSLRVIDIGPDAQSPEAEQFRQFWEPKSQLRLQNGTISETVVWHVDSFSQRRAIIKYILTHALKRANINSVVVHYTLLERFIDLKNVYFTWRDDVLNQKENGDVRLKRKRLDDDDDEELCGRPIGIGEEVYQKVLHSYNEINKVLRSIQDMKHAITSIQPTSHHLRASGVFPPLPVNLQQRNKSLKRRKGVTMFPSDFEQIGRVLFIEPVEILVTLESSGKWPSELEALEAEKLDYLIQLGESLKAKAYSIKFSEDHLDVLYGQFVFRVRVRCQKELTMITAARGKQELHQRRYEHEILPRIHGALDQLYRQKPAFSLTCRLVKRWLSCHLMTSHINDITLDLIVAHLFLDSQPYTEPASSSCGFKRFLELVATHDWNESPLVVNFDNQLKVDEVNRIRNSMQGERAKYPALVICTPFDRERPSPWTRDQPNEDNLELFVKICSKARSYFVDNILRKPATVEECRALFRPNFRLFDLIVKLDSHVVQTFFMSIDPPKNYKIVGKEPSVKQASAFKVMPIVGMNVVEQFVSVLRGKFDNLAQFYYDRYGQRVIGVIMKADSERLLGGDMNRFIKDIKEVGAKLVESVSLRRDQ
jgi:U3 small nucleolar RNA-associated protein 22